MAGTRGVTADGIGGTGIEVPVGLYSQAVRQLLANEPLRAVAAESSVAGSLTVGEGQALEEVGLSKTAWSGAADRDPLARSVADYMALLETSLTTAEVAKRLKVDVSRVRQRLREGSLFGIDYDGERRLPRFQFERGLVLPGLREVIAALPTGLNPVDVAQWFLTENPDLEVGARTISPRDWLLRGESIEAVVELAHGWE